MNNSDVFDQEKALAVFDRLRDTSRDDHWLVSPCQICGFAYHGYVEDQPDEYWICSGCRKIEAGEWHYALRYIPEHVVRRRFLRLKLLKEIRESIAAG